MAVLDQGRVLEWLVQFDPADRPVAALIVEKLRLVSLADFQFFALNTLDRLIEARVKRPMALYAVRELSAGEATGYFDPTDDSISPRPGGPKEVGSEGIVAKLLRDFAKEKGPNVALDHASVGTLRAVKARLLVIVDDFVGSGKRVLDFISGIRRNKTVNSWISYGLVRIVVVTYGATSRGLRLVKAQPGVKSVEIAVEDVHRRRIYSRRDLPKVTRLCSRYARKISRSAPALGFKGTMSHTVFEHSRPNTLPAILRLKSKTWRPLFDVSDPRNMMDFRSPDDKESAIVSLVSLKQHRLARSKLLSRLGVRGLRRITLLAAVARRCRSHPVLAAAIGTSLGDCETLIAECVAAQWLTVAPRLQITPLGRGELRYAREWKLLDKLDVPLRTGYYFPQSLRRSASSSSAGHRES